MTDYIKTKLAQAHKESISKKNQAENNNDDLLLFVQKYPHMLARYPWMVNRYPHLFANNQISNFQVKTIH